MRSDGGSVRIASKVEHAKVVVGGGYAVEAKWGVGWITAFDGRRLRMWVAVCRASAQ
jgi:hypothetical protein